MLNQQDLSCTEICFPNGSEGIPDWFEHQSMGDTISFWFNKKIPTIRCIFLFPGDELPDFNLFLNGNDITVADFLFYYEDFMWPEHALLFDLKLDECINKRVSNKPELYEAIKNNEWNHVEVKRNMCYLSDTEEDGLSDTEKKEMKIGIHVSWNGYDWNDMEVEKSNKEGEVRFTNPYSRKRKLVEVGVSETEEDEDLSDTEGDETEILRTAQMEEGVGNLIFADSSLPQKISKQDERKIWGTFLGLGAS